MNLYEARALAISEAEDRLGYRFPETFEGFKVLVESQPSVERLEIMKAVAFRGWEEN